MACSTTWAATRRASRRLGGPGEEVARPRFRRARLAAPGRGRLAARYRVRARPEEAARPDRRSARREARIVDRWRDRQLPRRVVAGDGRGDGLQPAPCLAGRHQRPDRTGSRHAHDRSHPHRSRQRGHAEVGMVGGPDPQNRGPMRWDLVKDDNPELKWMRSLIALHNSNRALRIGDFRTMESNKLLAFERHTDKVLETALVLAPRERELGGYSRYKGVR